MRKPLLWFRPALWVCFCVCVCVFLLCVCVCSLGVFGFFGCVCVCFASSSFKCVLVYPFLGGIWREAKRKADAILGGVP